MLRIILFFRPLRYLEPGSGSLLIQLIVAALGGGLFFLIKSQWNVWFKRGKTKQNTKDDIEEIAPDEKKHSKPTTKEEKYAMIEVDSLKKPSKISTTAGKKKKIARKKSK